MRIGKRCRHWRLVFALGLCLGLTGPTVSAQSRVYLDHVSDLWPTDATKIDCRSGVVEFYIAFENQSGGYIVSTDLGFRVYSPDGVMVDATKSRWNMAIPWGQLYWDAGLFKDTIPGTTSDTIGFRSYSSALPGFPNGQSAIGYILTTPVDCADSTLTLCIDTTYYRPTHFWKWTTSVGFVYPTWGSALCWEIGRFPNEPPTFSACGQTVSFDHCDSALWTFSADDPDSDPVVYSLLSGRGAVNPSTGNWAFQPSISDVGTTDTIVILACDQYACGDTCTLSINYTNVSPQFVAGCNSVDTVLIGDTLSAQVPINSGDCDPPLFGYISPSLPAGAAFSIDSTGTFEFVSDSLADTTFKFIITVSDSLSVDSCEKQIVVLKMYDRDGDGVADEVDNCPDLPNPGQEDEDFDGEGDVCDSDSSSTSVLIFDENGLPTKFALLQNYPNPFNGTTTIQYALPRTSRIRVTLVNLLGQEVVELERAIKPAGLHNLTWDGKMSGRSDAPSGIYFVRFESDTYTESRKLLLLK